MRLIAVGAHRFEDVERGDRVLFEILARMLGAETDVGVGGQVEDEVAAGHRGVKAVPVERIAMDEAKARISAGLVDEFRPAGRRLSHPTTCRPMASNRSTRLLPMKPAAPVTKTLFNFQHPKRKAGPSQLFGRKNKLPD